MKPGNQRLKVGLGLLGSGVVGEAVQDIVWEREGKFGEDLEIEIRRVYTRRPEGKKWHASRPELFTESAEEVIDDPRVEIVVEVLGLDDPSALPRHRDAIVRALRNGKSVVTSDKAVLARYGEEIWSEAVRAGRQVRFEACVGGGIPIIRSLTESFAAESPEAVFGIVNGTCNYILSQMEKGGKTYDAALAEAQVRGYAETNPEADVTGADAEAKLLLLAAVAFGVRIEPGTIWRNGIGDIHAVDFRYAGKTGASTIKHFAVARRKGNRLQAFVSPVLVPRENLLADIDGPTNAICFKGERSGSGRRGRDCDYILAGPGAGGGPTAVAVLGDVCELARGGGRRFCGLPSLMPPGAVTLQPEEEIDGSFYLRFVVRDRAGIVGDIGQVFGKLGVNISEIWQLRHSAEELEDLARSHRLGTSGGLLPFVMTLEQATLGQMRQALDLLADRDYIAVKPVWFPIWRET
ncbi:MAG TPA: homoserine dehydrogenase [candidate division Zixibacteria bacterium]|nr:homoserine dehydrogenase [candidate division Zixibacteria bacterium]